MKKNHVHIVLQCLFNSNTLENVLQNPWNGFSNSSSFQRGPPLLEENLRCLLTFSEDAMILEAYEKLHVPNFKWKQNISLHKCAVITSSSVIVFIRAMNSRTLRKADECFYLFEQIERAFSMCLTEAAPRGKGQILHCSLHLHPHKQSPWFIVGVEHFF